MRVLWFTNDVMPAVQRRKGRSNFGSGHWMPSLLDSLLRRPGVQVEIATLAPGEKDDQFEDGGVTYFIIGQPSRPGIFFRCRRRDLRACVTLVRERAPDLVHIHGTERFYGLIAARGLISVPAIISIQGLLGPYLPTFFGALSPGDLWRSHRVLELATRRGLLWLYWDYVRGARREQEILARATSFMGRTDWDRAHLRSASPSSRYYHVGEVLRGVFKEKSWQVSQCERHSVIFTNCGEPRRGSEILISAIRIVRRHFPDTTLRLAGRIGTRSGYHRFLRRQIADAGLSGVVEFLGGLDGNVMARELCRAHVFALASYIENSPNSLCEAMQVGLPCVASFAGGIPSLVEHGRSGLLYPVGDAALLADAIMRIFRDADLATSLGAAARDAASNRHAPELVVSQLLNAYRNVIADAEDTRYTEAVSRA